MIGQAKGKSRLQQIVEWLCGGDDPKTFDGCLLFDECHKAKNFIAGSSGQSTKVPTSPSPVSPSPSPFHSPSPPCRCPSPSQATHFLIPLSRSQLQSSSSKSSFRQLESCTAVPQASAR